jgi:hypothetical protein
VTKTTFKDFADLVITADIQLAAEVIEKMTLQFSCFFWPVTMPTTSIRGTIPAPAAIQLKPNIGSGYEDFDDSYCHFIVARYW